MSETLYQPSQQDAYNQPSNPVSKRPGEIHDSNYIPSYNVVEKRGPNDTDPVPQPAPQARGIQGKGDDRPVEGRHLNEEDQKMAPPTEGDVYKAVTEKPGATGQEPSFTSHIEAKKAEQAGAREKVMRARAQGFDMGSSEGISGPITE